MAKTIGGLIALVLVAAGGWYVYTHRSPADTTEKYTLGTYSYACDNSVSFDMSPAEDLSAVKIVAKGEAPFTDFTLNRVSQSVYASEDGEVSFEGAGEGVTLTVGASTMRCNPIFNPETPPFNWGDSAEGAGSIQPEASLVVTESIRGKWQSTDDSKFVREFRENDVVIDYYDNEEVSRGLWVAYTKANAPRIVPFPIDASAVYLQLTMTGSQADTLNFKVSKLTPDSLQLVYMDRGGVQNYTFVQ